MDITEVPIDGYERVVHYVDDKFSAYIAVHNTRLGPALGGCRVKRYSSDREALDDALKLSKAMSYKSSLADLNYGGGKCVVNAPVATPEILYKVGQAIQHLLGQYITAEDVGTTLDDMKVIRKETPYVVCAEDGSPWTALGVSSCILRLFDEFDMWAVKDLSVWLQGLGKVGWGLMERLMDHGGIKVFVSDILSDRVQLATDKYAVAPVMANAFEVTHFADLYAPCAMGQVVNESNARKLPPMICGAANNQLDHEEVEALAAWLDHIGIIYVPDFLVNAGGVIAAAAELNGFDAGRLEEDVRRIADRMMDLFHVCEHENRNPMAAAIMYAEHRWI